MRSRTHTRARTRAAGRRWLAGWSLLPVLAVAGLAACTERLDPDAVVRIAIGEPHHLVPTNVNDPDGTQVLSALFVPLVDMDDEGRPYEVAAASVEPNEDSRVWTVKLRKEFTFHDGAPVTADNYIDAWNYGAYQPNEQRNHHLFARIQGFAELRRTGDQEPVAQAMSGLTKLDDHTFQVTLVEPFAEFRSMLSSPAFYPLPADAFEAPGVLRDEFEAAPVGNGRFQMAGTWERGERIRVERYQAYPGEPPGVGGVEFIIYEDPAAAYDHLLDGTVDVVTRIPADRLRTVENDLADRFLRHPAPGFQYLAVPSYQEELANPSIRRAISMAIDRDQIAESVFGGTQAPARAFVAPVVPGARYDSCGMSCMLNPAAARDLYEVVEGPERLTITYNADGGHQQWVEATCEQLRANLGVTCQAEAVPNLTELLARVDAEEPVGLIRLGWAMDYPSMESYLAPVYSSTGSANFSGYQNAEFDGLLAAAAAAASPEEAVAAYQQAEDLLAKDLPVIPLRFTQHTVGHSPKVRGIRISRLGHLDLDHLEAVR